jgi:glycosyltransferase involved in cell wall biosynthesis
LRILHILPFLTGGGAEQQLAYLGGAHAAAGHDVHIAYMSPGPGAAPASLGPVKMHPIPERSSSHPGLWKSVLRVMRHVRPDVVQTWMHQMDIVGGGTSALLRIPWVLREPSAAECYASDWRARLRVRIAGTASAVVSNSRGGDRYWAQWLPPRARHVVPNGLPLADIEAAPAARPEGVSPDAPLVVYAGRLEALKNLERLVDALARVMRDGPLTAVLCGNGSMRAALTERVRAHGLNQRILLPGHMPPGAVWGLMKRADAFTFVSTFEGMPNVDMEAMACGAPLLVSDIPAHRDFLTDDVATFAPPGDTDAIVRGLRSVLCAGRAHNARAAAARGLALQWSTDAMASRYLAIYQAAADGASDAAP